MKSAQQKANAKEFVKRWQAAEGNEDREARSFWLQFAEELLGIASSSHVLEFERRVKGRKIDVFYEDMGVLIENKSRGCSLDEKYVRSKKVGAETPYEQAKWYADNLPHSIRPRWIITCNFDEIRIHDLENANPGTSYTSIALDELPDMLYLFGFFTDRGNSRIEKEKQLSVKAGELVGRLYDELSGQYQNIAIDKREQRSLNVLIVRLVFLLYAEDAGLLAKRGQFYDYLKGVSPNRMRNALMELFDVLDTPDSERDPYLDPELAAFPYVNGGLFTHEDIVIPNLTDQIKVDLLAEASAGFDWRSISPTIFGAAFESTLNPETRRAGGMHYTSPENIHKVIDPLFLDDLKAELAEIEGEKVERARIQKLRVFQRKLASLTFLDPAAGSHNFLTETYISLRRLELRVIENLQGDQTSFDIVDNPIMVNIGQFYAIEINDFAVSVGKTALWIAEQQMLEKTQELLPYQEFAFLPLKSNTNSVCANALRIDWNDVLPAEKCSYIIGNPPFYGARMQSKEQKEDIAKVFHGSKNCGNIDYVAGWYMKASEYIGDRSVRCAFVSTNSICQGEQVANIWAPIYDLGVRIDFAHDTFRWSNEAANQAHVFCVIVGFSKLALASGSRRLFHHKSPDSESVELHPAQLNAYLADAPDVFVWSRSKPLCNVPAIGIGSQPIDGGNYLFKEDEMSEFVAREPGSARFFHPWLGSDEFLNNRSRYTLWLGNATPQDLLDLPLCRERIERVRAFREKSNRAQTKKAAATPERYGTEVITGSASILIPKVSSERRRYIPLGFIGPETFCSDLVFLIPDASLYHFGVLHSQFHNAWMRAVAGRLKSDYRYSGGVVYNNFVWPNPTPEQKERIEACAQMVLDARDQFPGKSLAHLYDPDKMPQLLKDAHHELDMAVEAAYGVEFNGDEERVVAHLFKLYAETTGERH